MGDGLYALVDSVGEGAKAAVKYTEEVENDSPMTSMSTQRATELQVCVTNKKIYIYADILRIN